MWCLLTVFNGIITEIGADEVAGTRHIKSMAIDSWWCQVLNPSYLVEGRLNNIMFNVSRLVGKFMK